jgi:hypothetical protein
MPKYVIKRVRDGKHKFVVRIPNSDFEVFFGASGYSDYTKHKDPERKKRYIARHSVNEDWKDPRTAGFWSRWILWNKPSLQESVEYMKKKFGMNIIIS